LKQNYFTIWKKWLWNLLFTIMVISLAVLSFHYHIVSDWTQSKKNSLSPATMEMLDTIDTPVLIHSYTAKNSIKSQIQQLIKPYQYYNPNIKLEFINPALDPELIRKLGIQVDGELVIHLSGKTEHLTEISEEKLSNTILKLSLLSFLVRGSASHKKFTPCSNNSINMLISPLNKSLCGPARTIISFDCMISGNSKIVDSLIVNPCLSKIEDKLDKSKLAFR